MNVCIYLNNDDQVELLVGGYPKLAWIVSAATLISTQQPTALVNGFTSPNLTRLLKTFELAPFVVTSSSRLLFLHAKSPLAPLAVPQLSATLAELYDESVHIVDAVGRPVAFLGFPTEICQPHSSDSTVRTVRLAGVFAPPVDCTTCDRQLRYVGQSLRAWRRLNGGTHVWPAVAKVQLIAADVDGTLTVGTKYFDGAGRKDALQSFHTRDFHGASLAVDRGVHIALISAEDSEALRGRIRSSTKINTAILGCKDKWAALSDLADSLAIPASRIAYVGDDISDCQALRSVLLGAAVADADAIAEDDALVTLTCKGGHGALREVVNMVLGL
mmetsp:Transcript_14081/g.44319  ORF Transcript_14081/g.44319 Transcript_14081/m.44319 type:complete len:330 (-) Transcript_14081:189-1178(-)